MQVIDSAAWTGRYPEQYTVTASYNEFPLQGTRTARWYNEPVKVPPLPRPARHPRNKPGDHWLLALLDVASILEGTVLAFSLGYLNWELRCWVLFDLLESD